jgi:hypothetical protein
MSLKRIYLFSTLVVLFLFSRFLKLDGDIPIGWDIAQYNQFDELLYSLPGLNLFHYGTWDIEPWGLSILHHDPAYSIWNFAQFFLLNHLNNPLIALRLPAVMCGLTVYLIYLTCLEHLKQWLVRAGCFDKSIYTLFIIFPLFDLTFFLSNIINEPTIYRLMGASLIFLILLKTNVFSVKKAFVLGVVTAGSIAFIYIYNAFLVIFIILFLLKNKAHALKLVAAFLSGATLVFIVWLLLNYFIRGLTLYEIITNLLTQRPINVNVGFYDYLIRLASVFATNFLIFSPVLTVFIVMSSNFLLTINVNKKLIILIRKVSLLTFLYLISYTVQLLFVPDFPQRKGLVIYTPILIMSYLIATALISNTTVIKEKYGRSVIVIFNILIFVCILIYSLKLAKFIDHRGYFLLFKDSNIVSAIYVVIYLLAMIAFVCALYFRNNKFKKNIVIIIICSAIFSNGYLVVKHCLTNTDRSFFDMIADVRKLPAGNLIGNWSYGISFANRDNKPFISPYYSKYLNDPLWMQSDNTLNLRAFDLFFSNDSKPLYTVVQGRDQLVRILDKFPSSKVRYANEGFRDQTSYISHGIIKRSVLIGERSEGESLNEMYVIQLNP